MRKYRYHIAMLCAMLAWGACSEDREEMQTLKNHTMTIDIAPTQWTYLNVSKGLVVGTSDIDDAKADAQWAGRNDWDMAIGNGVIRTNGGTSGKGKGSMCTTDVPFDEIESAPIDGYVTDRKDVYIW